MVGLLGWLLGLSVGWLVVGFFVGWSVGGWMSWLVLPFVCPSFLSFGLPVVHVLFEHIYFIFVRVFVCFVLDAADVGALACLCQFIQRTVI